MEPIHHDDDDGEQVRFSPFATWSRPTARLIEAHTTNTYSTLFAKKTLARD